MSAVILAFPAKPSPPPVRDHILPKAACPFCQCISGLTLSDDFGGDGDEGGPFYVQCLACGAEGPKLPTPTAAAEAWDHHKEVGP